MLPLIPLAGMAVGAGMSGLGSILGRNATKNAQRDLRRTGQQLTNMYQPYIDYGQQAMPTLNEQYGKLLNNPQDIYGQLAGGYQKSPGYDYRMQEMEGALKRAASAGGQLGGSQHQLQAMQGASGIAGQDFDKYLSTMLGLYGTGLEGTQGQFNTGANMMQGLGGNLTGLRNSGAQLGYTGGQNTGQALGGMGGMMSLLSAMMGMKGQSGGAGQQGMMNPQMGGMSGGQMYAPQPWQQQTMSEYANPGNKAQFGYGMRGY